MLTFRHAAMRAEMRAILLLLLPALRHYYATLLLFVTPLLLMSRRHTIFYDMPAAAARYASALRWLPLLLSIRFDELPAPWLR